MVEIIAPQTGVFQDAEMSRDGWPARVEPRRDLAGGARRGAEEPEYLATGRVRQGAKNGVPNLHNEHISLLTNRLSIAPSTCQRGSSRTLNNMSPDGERLPMVKEGGRRI
jgi:hypothetical protein